MVPPKLKSYFLLGPPLNVLYALSNVLYALSNETLNISVRQQEQILSKETVHKETFFFRMQKNF